MATLTIRNLDEELKARLRVRAARNGCSMEQEVHRGTRFATPAVTRAERLLGVALLPAGKRRERIAHAIEQTLEEDFTSNCLAFDAAAANEYAILVAACIRVGKPISTEDAQIAAIALANSLALVTRNGKDFAAITGLTLIDPWMG